MALVQSSPWLLLMTLGASSLVVDPLVPSVLVLPLSLLSVAFLLLLLRLLSLRLSRRKKEGRLEGLVVDIDAGLSVVVVGLGVEIVVEAMMREYCAPK